MSRASFWANKDGLAVGFGTRTAEVNSGAAVCLGGKRQQVVVRIVGGAEIKDSDVSAQLLHGAIIPTDSLIESAKLYVTTAFAGTNAVMDIGTYNATTGAAIADNGIDSAVATATLTDNAVITCDGAGIGAVTAAPTKIGVTYDTAAFTTGEATLVIEYITESTAE